MVCSARQVGIFLTIAMLVVTSAQQTEIRVPKVGGMENNIICQGEKKNLSCTNSSLVMVIYDVRYGRTVKGNKICPYRPTSPVKVDTNDQNTGCGETVVTANVSSICHKKKWCEISVDEKLLGRPCAGIFKYLKIIYACGLPVYITKIKPTTQTTPTNKTLPQQRTTTVKPTATTVMPTTPLKSSCTTNDPTSVPLSAPLPNETASIAAKTDQLSSTKDSTSYLAVFVVTALCAALIFGAVFGRCWYLRRRTKSQKFAVLHRPKRFLEPPRELKQNGHVSRRQSRDVNMNDDMLSERPLTKPPDVAKTRADVESRQKQPGVTNHDEGDGQKGDNSTFYVNPMYDRNRQNSSASHPRIHGAHRLSNASDGKGGPPGSPARGKQQTRCNSMGNIPRSNHASMQRRHPSAGNVNKDGYSDAYQQQVKGQQHPQQQQHPHQQHPQQHGPQQQNLLYNAPQIQTYPVQGQVNYQGQGQGNYQGQGQVNYQGQGNYQGQQRGPASPARQAGQYPNNMNQRPNMAQGSPAKTPQRTRPMGPMGPPYQSPGPPGRPGIRPSSPYECGATEKAHGGAPRVDIDPNSGQRYQGNGEANQRGANPYGDRVGLTVNPGPTGPVQYRSNGPRRESWGTGRPMDGRRLSDPSGHPDHAGSLPVYDMIIYNDRKATDDIPTDGDTVGRLNSIRMSISKKMGQLQQALFSK